MAIMWDPPADRVSLEPTPAELAWTRWLLEALTTGKEDVRAPELLARELTSEVKPAA